MRRRRRRSRHQRRQFRTPQRPRWPVSSRRKRGHDRQRRACPLISHGGGATCGPKEEVCTLQGYKASASGGLIGATCRAKDDWNGSRERGGTAGTSTCTRGEDGTNAASASASCCTFTSAARRDARSRDAARLTIRTTFWRKPRGWSVRLENFRRYVYSAEIAIDLRITERGVFWTSAEFLHPMA